MLRILKGNWAVATIILLELLLFVANFRPGTYLIGWDSVMPELNFAQNFKRNVFSVWQEYRGLGLLDGMAYAANLPHTVFLWILHFVLPQSMLRYFFIFVMHVTGGLGMYFLLKRILPHVSYTAQASHIEHVKATALAGALFYLFNLATIQMFYAPLEAFAVHFAFLPWLIFSLISYLKMGARKDLLLFVLFSFLSLPQAFVPQLFAVYILLAILVSIFNTRNVKRLVSVSVVIFVINAFWALPYAYSALTNSQTILEAKINQMSSGDIFAKNQARGNIKDVVFMKGFMLDVVEYDKSGQNLPIMGEWINYTNSPVFYILAFAVLVVAFLGVLAAISYRQRALYPFLAALVIAFVFLGNNILGFRQLNDFIRENIPVVGEAFRFSFTKFSILFALCYSIFFAFGTQTILSRVKHINLHTTCYILLAAGILLYALPAFRGHFLFDSLRVKVPGEYFQTIEFFAAQDKNTRIVAFPQPTFWSWRFHNNGYRGSGFLWYGVSQPMLDRAFDPWSRQNENYYWEVSYAVYSKNPQLLEKVFEKYQVNWILVDENVVNPTSPKALYYDELETLLESSNKVELTQIFGKIRVYRVDLETPVKKFVYVAQGLPTVSPVYKWNNYDVAYQDLGSYASSLTTNYQLPTTDYFYPFHSLFTGRVQEELEFEVEDKGDYFIFRKELAEDLQNYIVGVPEITTEELEWVDPADLSRARELLEDVYFNGKVLEVRVPKAGGYYSADIEPASHQDVLEARDCNNLGGGRVKNEVVSENGAKLLRLSATGANNCGTSFYIGSLPHEFSYLVTAQNRNVKGKSMVFWLENLNSRKPDIEASLPNYQLLTTNYFVQPPMAQDGLGYTLHFDTISIGSAQSVNDLGKVTVNPIPYKFLTELVLFPPDLNSHFVSGNADFSVSHPNPSLYEVTIEQNNNEAVNSTLVLSQSYNEGWKAYRGNFQFSIFNFQFLAPIFEKEIKEHVLVNNWSNGWRIDECGGESGKCKVVIVYLPQYLEYLGFGILIVVLVGIFWKASR